MPKKILIIKIGATGDVVRTTVLLHLFRNAHITWITAKHNIAVLPFQQPNLKSVMAIENVDKNTFEGKEFDLVLSLDDDLKCASIVNQVNAKEVFGTYIKDNKIVYTTTANEWFDMGLSSRFGKEKADQIKWENKDSFQEILFRMLGVRFNGEEYLIREDVQQDKNPKLIGIEDRAGARWPTKLWNQYPALAKALQQKGYEIVFFQERENIKDYFQDIANCALVVCGDTLGMHIALAMKIPTVCLFTCTSAVEIYGYNRMKKIVSPYLKQAFYKTSYVAEAVETINLDAVIDSIEQCLAENNTVYKKSKK